MDVQLIENLIRKHHRHGSLGVEKLLFLYRKKTGITIEQAADLYVEIYRWICKDTTNLTLMGSDCGGIYHLTHIRETKEHIRDLRKVGVAEGREFMTTRKYSYFVQKLQRILRRKWQSGERLPSYALLIIKKGRP